MLIFLISVVIWINIFDPNPSGLYHKNLNPRPLLLKEKGRCVIVYVTDYYIFGTAPPFPPGRRRWRMRSFIVHH